MAAGEWEKLATEIIIPGLQQAAVELNGIRADQPDPGPPHCVQLRPPRGRCAREDVLRVDAEVGGALRRRPTSPFLWPEGWLTIDDDAARLRVEETASGARPVSSYLPSSDVSVSGIRARALAFAERLVSAAAGDDRTGG